MSSVMDKNYIEVAAAIIVEDGGTFLAAKRTGGYLDGLWEFPGGKIEEEETSCKAAEREIFEELGVYIKAHKKVLVQEHMYPDKNVRLHFVLSELKPGERVKLRKFEEVNNVAWFTPSTVPLDGFCAADKEAFNKIPWSLIFKDNGEE